MDDILTLNSLNVDVHPNVYRNRYYHNSTEVKKDRKDGNVLPQNLRSRNN